MHIRCLCVVSHRLFAWPFNAGFAIVALVAREQTVSFVHYFDTGICAALYVHFFEFLASGVGEKK